jgi:hypothetical protein
MRVRQSFSRFLHRRWERFRRTPFGCLLSLFVARMFHGGDEPGSEQLSLGIGAILTLLAMPGLLVSLLMFEKYGSLIRFLRGGGDGVFDPFTATIPDEYFFIVLSMTVTGAAALWRWDSIFLDRRDHTNLVPLPVSLRAIFLANFSGILVLAALFTVVVNAASIVLFPIAVVGSQSSFAIFFRFATGHAIAVLSASAFSFFAIFALAGLLMAILPAAAFRRASLVVRFMIAIVLLALLASVFTMPSTLLRRSVAIAHTIANLPPVSFLGLARTVWGKGGDPFTGTMTHAAISGFAVVVLVAVITYAVSFRCSFLRIPETTDVPPLPRIRLSLSPLVFLHSAILRNSSHRACYHFIVKTLLRSDAHLQIVSAFAALGLVAAAESLMSIRSDPFFFTRHAPSADFLSIPFTLSYCLIVGIRFAFEIPSDLRANWIFKLWLSLDDQQARPIARRVLLAATLPWLVPCAFAITLFLFGWTSALLHAAILTASTVLLVEILLVKFRKIPFTCSYPPFESNSGVILVAYLFGFFVFANYIPELERWSLAAPLRAVCFVPLFTSALAVIYAYRKQMLDMDNQLIFEEHPASGF